MSTIQTPRAESATSLLTKHRRGWTSLTLAATLCLSPSAWAALGPGDIIVYFSQPPEAGKLLKTDPATGAKEVFSDFTAGSTPLPESVVVSLAVTKERDVLALANTPGHLGSVLIRLDGNTGAPAIIMEFPTTMVPRSLVLEPTGTALVGGSDSAANQSTIHRIDLQSGALTEVASINLSATGMLLHGLAVEADGSILALESTGEVDNFATPGGDRRRYRVIRLTATGGNKQTLVDLQKHARFLALHPSGSYAIAGSDTGDSIFKIDLAANTFTTLTLPSLGSVDPTRRQTSLAGSVAFEQSGTLLSTDGFQLSAPPPDFTRLFRTDFSTLTSTLVARYGDQTSPSRRTPLAVVPGVRGTQDIQILAAESQVVEAAGPNGAVAVYNPTASTASGDPVPVDCNPVSGALFPLGETQVTCAATATDGSTATAAFTVLVRDTTPPVLTLPGTIDSSSTTVTYQVGVQDLVSSVPFLSCSPESGSVFPEGVSTVSCRAVDSAGNVAEDSFLVRVAAKPTGAKANDDLYGDRQAILADGDRKQEIRVRGGLGVLVNDTPKGERRRLVRLASGPVQASGSGTASVGLQLKHDGSFTLELTAPKAATAAWQRRAAKRGTYKFAYTLTYGGITTPPATVTIIVK